MAGATKAGGPRSAFVRTLRSLGCEVDTTGGGHYLVTTPTGERVVIGQTPKANGRTFKNEMAQLRRCGVPIDSRGNPTITLDKDGVVAPDLREAPADLGLCQQCGSTTGLVHDFSWQPPIRCLNCGWTTATPVLSAPVEVEPEGQPAMLTPPPTAEEATMPEPSTPEPEAPAPKRTYVKGHKRLVHLWLDKLPPGTDIDVADFPGCADMDPVQVKNFWQSMGYLAKEGIVTRVSRGHYRTLGDPVPAADAMPKTVELLDVLGSGQLLARGDNGKLYRLSMEELG